MESIRRPISCPTCPTRSTCEWCDLGSDDLRELDRAKVTNVYTPHQVIFYEGNPCLGIYCIESGTIALRKSDESGNTVILSMAEPGDTLGYRAFFADEAYRASAEALTDARVCFIDRETVRALLERNPKVGQRFLGHIARDVIQSEDQRFLMSTQKVRPRLAHLLLALRDRHASVDDSGRLEFELPYSRQDLAAHLGARPETIARTIKRMDDDGVAQFSGRRVVVDDLDRLLDEVELAV